MADKGASKKLPTDSMFNPPNWEITFTMGKVLFNPQNLDIAFTVGKCASFKFPVGLGGGPVNSKYLIGGWEI